MGKQLVWQDRFNIGVDIIDKEHRKLFSIMNRLLASTEEETKSKWVCEEGIKYFKDHAMKHFAEEEVYMASIGYQGFETHRRIHDDFRKKTLPALEKELKHTRYSPDAVNHFLGVCAGWLIGHTLTEDHAITGKSDSKWSKVLPEEEQTAMKMIVKELLYDMFQLKVNVISDHYGGEKFGKGIYYRLLYKTKTGERLENILVFEEKLLFATVGKIMDIQTDKMNTMLMNMTRYTAQQFVSSVQEHFLHADSYEIKEENLLTYDQFQNIFEKADMHCSLLLDTGEGYFAYCIMASPKSQSETGPAIKADNAMVEIRKYLKKNREGKKRKILVVDDSKVVLHTMKELFEADYEVALAKSGVSAIQSITLDKPDIVLLDYEMPVCDGGQVLEMIRSEEGFSDIPVFFLAGTADMERVKKIVPLKPEGYLSKKLKLAEIKQAIDQFFEKKKDE